MATSAKKRKATGLTAQVRLVPGASPGTITVTPGAPKPVVTVIAYGPETIEEKRIDRVEDLRGWIGGWPVTWVNVEGLGDAETIQKLGEIFSLHRLALEDVTDIRQRAKVEDYPDHLFFITRMTTLAEHLETEQLSIFLGQGYVVTFQETPGDCFDPVRERIRRKRGRIRSSSPDYLAYALLDAIIDNYFPVLEAYGEKLEVMEDDIVRRPDPRMVPAIHALRRDLLAMRRAVWPLREAVNSLVRDESPRFAPETRLYLRDCYDHVIQILEVIETYREVTSALMETYLSSISNRMNEVMKVLTIISTIFIPLSFVASVYGMNFVHFPELQWRWGYPLVLLVMAGVASGLLLFFRRRGWLGSRPAPKS